MIPNSRLKLAVVIGAAIVLSSGIFSNTFADDASVEKAYVKQFKALTPDDIDGHIELADWCYKEKAWAQLLRQCNHILSLPGNANKHHKTKLYRDIAKKKLARDDDKEEEPSPPSSTGSTSAKTSTGDSILLTDEQVQILRHMELKLDQPERIKVSFKNDVLDRFWDFKSTKEKLPKEEQSSFNRQSAPQKAQEMIAYLREQMRGSTEDKPFKDEFSADIEIKTDPMVFKEYRTKIWPIIRQSCAVTNCHGANGSGFSLINKRVMSPNSHYTNFMILHEFTSNGKRLIDRDTPEKSTLLTCGLPADIAGENAHPMEIKPPFRGINDRKYERVRDWIHSLRLPAPDYGFSVSK